MSFPTQPRHCWQLHVSLNRRNVAEVTNSIEPVYPTVPLHAVHAIGHAWPTQFSTTPLFSPMLSMLPLSTPSSTDLPTAALSTKNKQLKGGWVLKCQIFEGLTLTFLSVKFISHLLICIFCISYLK